MIFDLDLQKSDLTQLWSIPHLLDGLVDCHAPDEFGQVPHLPRRVLDHGAHVHHVGRVELRSLLPDVGLRRVDALVVVGPLELSVVRNKD